MTSQRPGQAEILALQRTNPDEIEKVNLRLIWDSINLEQDKRPAFFMRYLSAVRFSIIGIFCLCAFSLQAQKVGLVFSGGAAKGLAHIGVLRALEENDIPIDYITGTSMGAVIGSFYAAGFSPEEIEALALDPAFEHWIDGTSTEKYVYNYTKAQDNASWITLDLLIDNQSKASLNSPLANDLVLNFVLNEYLSQATVRANADFDQLFVPFRAISAEVFSQKVVPIDSGSLMQAVRSSMAVPFFYSPVKFEGKFLFDGGVYNNFPVDIMKDDFSPDIVIGANVAEKRKEVYPSETDEEILQDALIFLFLDKVDPGKLSETDIFLEPDLEGLTALDFDQAPRLIKAGYDQTIAKMAQIKERIKRRVGKAEIEERRKNFRSSFKDYTFGELRLIGFEPKQEKFLKSLLSFKEGEKSLIDIRNAYFQLVSEPYFKNIYPSFSYDYDKDHYVLELYLKRAAKSTLSVDLGGNLSTRNINALALGLRLNRFGRFLNTYKLSATTGAFYESLQLATRFNLNPKTRLFVEPVFTFNEWNYLDAQDFLNDDFTPNILERIDRSLGVTVGLGTGQRSVITLGLSGVRNTDEFSNTPDVSTDASLDELDFFAFKANLDYERNSLNLKQFPTSGTRFYAGVNLLSGRTEYVPGSTSVLYNPSVPRTIQESRDWLTFRLHFEEYGRVSGRYTLGWMFNSVYSNQPLFTNFRSSLLYASAFEPMFDSKTFFLDKYRAYSYVGAGVKNIWTLNKDFQFRLEIYGFSAFRRPVELMNQNVELANGFDDVYFTGMAALVYNTILGPLSLRLNYYEEDKSRLGLMLSYGYIIFNGKSGE